MTTMLLFPQGASKNIPARAVFMWLYLLEDNSGLEFCETKLGLETSPI